jgi:hypothetical protein
MNYKQLLALAALYSMVLVQSCVTVPRIDKKDSRNNQFSTQLQNWMAIKHPQKIDTTAKVISSDTTIELTTDSTYYTIKYQPYSWEQDIKSDSIYYGDSIYTIDSTWDVTYPIPTANLDSGSGFYAWGRNKGGIIGMTQYIPTYIDTIRNMAWNGEDTVKWTQLWVKHDTVIKTILRTKTITIHDTITKIVVNGTELNALKTYLQVSRDSTNKFILKYTQQQSTSRARLIWIIVLSIILAVGIYFTIKKGIL